LLVSFFNNFLEAKKNREILVMFLKKKKDKPFSIVFILTCPVFGNFGT
jgi:hypothetical protein